MAAPLRTCEQCGYALAGLRENICPECGTPFDPTKPIPVRVWKRWLCSAFAMFIIVYAPYGWLVMMDYPWSEYRWLWIKSWLALPLFLPAFFLRSWTGLEFDDTGPLIIMSVLALTIVLMLARLAMRGRWWFIIIAAIVLLFSIFNSIGMYGMFRM